MTQDDYQAAITAIAMAARVIALHDLPRILEGMERAEAVGPLFNPTLYIEKEQAMREDKELVQAAMPLYRLARQLQTEGIWK